MAVRVFCPACRSGLTVYTARYLVVVNCHVCGHEFMAQGHELPEKDSVPPPESPEELWGEAEPGDGKAGMLTFCPMCGDLAAESARACPSCGEPLPDDDQGQRAKGDLSIHQVRRFRTQAQFLGVLWIFLAFLLAEHDFWVSETRVELPVLLSGGRVVIPPIPVTATVLVGIAAFALVGQFWAIAVGGLLNYLILFFVAWHFLLGQASVITLVVLTLVMILTHVTLHQAASARFR